MSSVSSKTTLKYHTLVMFLLMLPFSAAWAIKVPTIDVMFETLSKNMTPLIIATSAISYVLGFVFVISALLDLKKLGESHGSGGSISGPIIKFIAAMALIFLPSIVETGRYTLWGVGHTDSIFYYTGVADKTWDTVYRSSVLVMKAIGYIAIVRGFTMLSRAHQQGAQAGSSTASTGKALVYIVGGIFAVNIVATARVVAATLGFVL